MSKRHKDDPAREASSDDEEKEETSSEDNNESSDDDGSEDNHHTMDTFDRQWMKRYHDLKDYYNKYKTFSIPETRIGRYKTLANWMSLQRQLRYKRKSGKRLNRHREHLLNRINFPWKGKGDMEDDESSPGESDGEEQRSSTEEEEESDGEEQLSSTKELPEASTEEEEEEEESSDGEKQHSSAKELPEKSDRKKQHSSTEEEGAGEGAGEGGGTFSKLDPDKRWMIRYKELKLYHKKYHTFTVRPSIHSGLYGWVIRQRRHHYDGFLCDGRRKLLEDIGFVESGTNKRKWSSVDSESDDSSTSSEEEQQVTSQDIGFLQSDMDKMKPSQGQREQVTKMNDSDSLEEESDEEEQDSTTENDGSFSEADPEKKRWMERYRELKWYYRKYQTLTIRPSINRGLYDWGKRQQQLCNKGTLADDRMKLLEDIGFLVSETNKGKQSSEESESDDSSISSEEEQQATSRRPHFEAIWNQKYKELKAYYRKHGTFTINGSSHRSLQLWVNRQRQLSAGTVGRETGIPEDRRKLLDAIGFDWRPSGKKLKQNEEDSVSGKDSISEEDSAINDSSTNDLDSIDTFKVGTRAADQNFMANYNLIREHYNKHGHFNGPYRSRQLYQWVYRTRRRKDMLPRNRRRLLARIGFDWDGNCRSESSGEESSDDGSSTKFHPHDNRAAVDSSSEEEESEDDQFRNKSDRLWMERYEELQRFYRKHGKKAPIPLSDTYKSLNFWARYQRYMRDTMPKKRRRLLDRIGFDFTMQNEHAGKRASSDSNSNSEDEGSSMGESNGPEKDEESSVDDSVRTSHSNFKLPANKRGELERYMGIVQAQIIDKQREVNELKTVCSEISGLLKKRIKPTL